MLDVPAAGKGPHPACRPPSPILRTGEGTEARESFARCGTQWEKVPDRADEGLSPRAKAHHPRISRPLPQTLTLLTSPRPDRGILFRPDQVRARRMSKSGDSTPPMPSFRRKPESGFACIRLESPCSIHHARASAGLRNRLRRSMNSAWSIFLLDFLPTLCYLSSCGYSLRRGRCRQRLGIAEWPAAPAVGWIRNIPPRARRVGPGGITTPAPLATRHGPGDHSASACPER